MNSGENFFSNKEISNWILEETHDSINDANSDPGSLWHDPSSKSSLWETQVLENPWSIATQKPEWLEYKPQPRKKEKHNLKTGQEPRELILCPQTWSWRKSPNPETKTKRTTLNP